MQRITDYINGTRCTGGVFFRFVDVNYLSPHTRRSSSSYTGMGSCSSISLLHSVKTLLGRLLGLFRVVGVVDSGLETASHVVGVLVTLRFRGRLEVARVKHLRYVRLCRRLVGIFNAPPCCAA